MTSQIQDNKSPPAGGASRGKYSLQLVVKHAFDKLVAGISLIILLPLLVLVAVIIKADSNGPVLFRQRRNGYGNMEFGIWKFRTMTVMENGADFKQATRGDARVTRVGRFLRRTSIDELPQLINVLTGDMSLVGPRPHPVALNDRFRPLIEKYDQRCMMRPGLTGLAQISGYRGATESTAQMAGRINKDIQYIRKWNLWLDIKIIILTPLYGLLTEEAF